MDIKIARGVSARIWYDFDYQHIEMDVKLAEEIAQKLKDYANKSLNSDTKKRCECSGFPLESDYCKYCGGYKCPA